MKKLKVLLVDDDEWIRQLVPSWLESLNCETVSLPCYQGTQMIQQGDYNLIILDEKIKSENGSFQSGREIAQSLLEDPKTKEIPRLLITGFDAGDIAKESLRSGLFKEIVYKDPRLEGKNLVFKKSLEEAVEKHRLIPLNIAISGLGKFGLEILKEIEEEPFAGTITLHSEYYKDDYSRALRIAGIPESESRIWVPSLEEMFYSGPKKDVLVMTAGKHGEATPKPGEITPPRETRFWGAMKILEPRYQIITKALNEGLVDLLFNQSGPEDLILYYLMNQMQIAPGRISCVSPETIRAKELLRKDYNIKDLKDIDLHILGGRSWPVPNFSSCLVNKRLLTEVDPSYTNPETKDRFIERIKEEAVEEMKAVNAEGQTYIVAPRMVKKMLNNIAKGITSPPEEWHAWNPIYQQLMRGIVKVKYGKTSTISWDLERNPKLDEYEEEKLKQGVAWQKRTNEEYIKEFLRRTQT